jgi:hypothetical protein
VLFTLQRGKPLAAASTCSMLRTCVGALSTPARECAQRACSCGVDKHCDPACFHCSRANPNDQEQHAGCLLFCESMPTGHNRCCHQECVYVSLGVWRKPGTLHVCNSPVGMQLLSQHLTRPRYGATPGAFVAAASPCLLAACACSVTSVSGCVSCEQFAGAECSQQCDVCVSLCGHAGSGSPDTVSLREKVCSACSTAAFWPALAASWPWLALLPACRHAHCCLLAWAAGGLPAAVGCAGEEVVGFMHCQAGAMATDTALRNTHV